MPSQNDDIDVIGAPSKIDKARQKRWEKIDRVTQGQGIVDPKFRHGMAEEIGRMGDSVAGALEFLYKQGLGAADIVEAMTNIAAMNGNPIPQKRVNALKKYVSDSINMFRLDHKYEKPRFDPYQQADKRKAARKEKKKNKSMEDIK